MRCPSRTTPALLRQPARLQKDKQLMLLSLVQVHRQSSFVDTDGRGGVCIQEHEPERRVTAEEQLQRTILCCSRANLHVEDCARLCQVVGGEAP